MPKLVLFDIDGTILHGQRNGARALIEATETIICDSVNENISLAGNTDTHIVYEFCKDLLPEEDIASTMPAIFCHYLTLLESYFTLENGVVAYDSMVECIKQLAEYPDVVIGLLTGNIQRGAEIKLQLFDLFPYFKLGAYGDDARHRVDLPEIAIRRALHTTGIEFKGKNVVVIGDTRNDVLCGQHVGAKTIAFCSSQQRKESLLELHPDFYCETDVAADDLCQAILND